MEILNLYLGIFKKCTNLLTKMHIVLKSKREDKSQVKSVIYTQYIHSLTLSQTSSGFYLSPIQFF